MSTSFQPPTYNNYSASAMQPTQQAPPSPVKGFGYVSGAGPGGSDNLNGYVGGKPETREEPGNPQALRRNTNLASPDPALSQSAFTESQFTSNISAAALQSQASRSGNVGNLGSGNSSSSISEPASAEDKRRESLRRYKETTGGSRSGGSCGFTPHPSLNSRTQTPTNRPVNGRGPMSGMDNLARQDRLQSSTPSGSTANATTTSSEFSPSVQSPASAAPTSAAPTFIAYTLADPGSMYKTFSGSTSWFRVMHLIVPEGKVVKRVHVASMMVCKKGASASDGGNNNANDTYSLRLIPSGVNGSHGTSGGGVGAGGVGGPVLFAQYDCDNTDNFQVYTMDLTHNPAAGKVASGLLEIQAQNASGFPILFSSAILEF